MFALLTNITGAIKSKRMSWVGHNYKIHNKEPTPESYSKEVLKVLEKKVLRTASGPKKHKYEDEQQLHH